MAWTEQSPNPSTWTKETQSGDWDKFEWLAYLLCEDGSYLLQENGNKILLESSINTDWNEDLPDSSLWSKKNNNSASWTKE